MVTITRPSSCLEESSLLAWFLAANAANATAPPLSARPPGIHGVLSPMW